MSIFPRITQMVYILGIILIIGYSYQGLAPQFDPWLNSDHAIHVMMSHDLQLPDDLYYWGQDRLGSLVPIVSHFAGALIPLAPVVMVGVVNYAMLTLAYGCFASFLCHWSSRLLLALAFFLPLRLYVEILHIGQPYAAQFACMGAATVGLRWLLGRWATAPAWQRLTVIGATMVAMVASVWMSDFSTVYFAIVLGAIAHYLFWQLSPDQRRIGYPIGLSDGITVGIVAIMGLGFLSLAKASASNSSTYTQLNSIGQMVDMVSRMGQSFGRNLRFETTEVWLSVAAWCFWAIASLLIYLLWRYHHRVLTILFSPSRLTSVFPGPLADEPTPSPSPPSPSLAWIWVGSWGLMAGISLIILLVANWVYQPDHIPQRYFVIIYGFFWVAVLGLTELIPRESKLILVAILGVLTMANIGSLQSHMTTIQPAKVETLAKIRALGPAGFIGNYWHSYVLCSVDPSTLNCTASDPHVKKRCPKNGKRKSTGENYPIGSVVRCERCVEKVLHSPIIYLVKEEWFDSFPKRIEQFGYCLERTGKSMTVADHTIAPYRKLN